MPVRFIPFMRHYLAINLKNERPCHKGWNYECTRCGDVFSSDPDEFVRCKCLNMSIDPVGRMDIQNPDWVKIFEDGP